MAAKKPVAQLFGVTATFNNLQVNVNVKAVDLASAVEEAKKLKFFDFVTTKGDIFDYEGPEVTSVWKN